MQVLRTQHTCTFRTVLPLQHVRHHITDRKPVKLNTMAVSVQKAERGSSVAQLPSRYKRLIGRKTGKDFRSVAEVEECEITEPGEGQVQVLKQIFIS